MSFADEHRKAWQKELAAKKPSAKMQPVTSALKGAVVEPEQANIAAPDIRNNKTALMTAAVEVDLSQLKSINSHVERDARKPALIEKYQEYLETCMQEDDASADMVVFQNLIWAMDTQAMEYAFRLGEFAIKHDIPTPDDYKRNITNVFAGEVASWALKQQKEDQSAEPWITELFNRYQKERWDLVDKIAAEIYRAMGKEAEIKKESEAALHHYQKAVTYNPDVGVKPDIARLEKALTPN